MLRNLTAAFIFLFSIQSLATLGESSQVLDTQKTEKLPLYSIALTLSDSTTGLTKVKEFRDSSDTVFGICWQGQRPQKFISGLLGPTYMERYRKAVDGAPKQKGRKFFSVKTDDFVLKTIDHGRSHRGCVYDPKLVPVGVNTNEIK
jgi:hypothetical protein